MYPADQSISSYGSNPTTPVNSPPPLTSHQSAQNMHPANTPGSSTTWQQLTPVMNNGPNPLNGQYAPELVHRGLHMVNNF